MLDVLANFGAVVQLSSLVLLVGAVAAYFITKRRRKRRDAEYAAKTRPQDVQPLRDDVEEKVSPRRFKWLNLCDHHYSALLESLRRQLLRRPDVWGVGLWPDAESESIARKCAEIFGYSAMPNDHLIPDDPLNLIAAFDGDGVQVAVRDIEEEFRLVIDDGWYEKGRTFSELVDYIRTHRGTAPNAVFRERRHLGWGCAVVLWLILAGIVWFTVETVIVLCEDARNGELGVKSAIGVIFALPIAVFSIYFAYLLVKQKLTDRREAAEEREQQKELKP